MWRASGNSSRPRKERPSIRLLTVFGTRPEIIRLSLIIRALDPHCEHYLAHTGQNHTPELSDVFFSELGIRAPDEHLSVRTSRFADQVADIIERTDALLERLKPDRVLILGDTNSGLCAFVAARRGVPVYHLEAGNRCYDDRVPEEVNRRVIDHCSTVLMPYTQRSKDNLVREGIDRERIFVVGNPIFEVLNAFAGQIDASMAHRDLGLEPGRYLIATMHRAENVDPRDRLERLFEGLHRVAAVAGLPLVVSVHPRTAERLRDAGLSSRSSDVRLLDPLGFFDFVRLERAAACVITDSGTVQEECSILHVPNVTIRDVTERPETVEGGSNIVAGADPDDLVRAVGVARSLTTDWLPPQDYLVPHPSLAIAKIVLGRLSLRRHA
jgi:UDP-N-acetylglucosamine 2-epimerase (non-hydrolysing)